MITYIGLDGEMSGTDLSSGSRLIQIGLAKIVDGEIESAAELINPGVMSWSEEAEGVHEFTQRQIEEDGLMPNIVDRHMSDWINSKGQRRDTVAVGFNVGSFDMPFLNYTLPLTFAKFSRRTVDLNSIIFYMSDTDREFQRIKRNAKAYAVQKMSGLFEGFKDRQHDAEYDAVMALYCFEYLRSLIDKA